MHPTIRKRLRAIEDNIGEQHGACVQEIVLAMRELLSVMGNPRCDDSERDGNLDDIVLTALGALDSLSRHARNGTCLSSKAMSDITLAAQEVASQHRVCKQILDRGNFVPNSDMTGDANVWSKRGAI